MISCPDMVEQLGLFIACMQRGLCVCYLNGAPLRDAPAEVSHGDFLAVYKSDSGRVTLLVSLCLLRPRLVDLLPHRSLRLNARLGIVVC